jgi:2-hydroxy-3-oxopropionate reductase
LLDAPVSGGEIGAINATLSIMVGGDPAAFERVRPILACMGAADRIVHVGDRPGAGQICKVCNQIAIGGALAGVSEALALARKAGVDAGRVRQALLGGFASSRVLEVHGERMLTGNYKPGFRTRLYQKDLRLAKETAAANGVPIPATEVVTNLVSQLVAEGGGDLDYSAVGQLVAARARL